MLPLQGVLASCSRWLLAALVTGGLVGLLVNYAPAAPIRQRSLTSSRDGVIAYSIKTGIYAVRRDGTGPRRLVPWRTGRCGVRCVVWKVPRHPRFSPDGRRLTYDVETHKVRHGVGQLDGNTRTVYVAGANGKHRRRVGLGHSPAFSADGSEVIYLVNPNAWPPTPITVESPEPFSDEYGPMKAAQVTTGATRHLPVPGAPEFSSDGRQMVYRHQVKLSDGYHRVVTVENTDGTDARSFSAALFYSEPVRFTADGRVSYDCPGPRHDQPDICLLDPATGRHRRFRNTREFWELSAVSSPSHRFLAVAGLHGLYVADADGRRLRVIVANGRGADYVQSNVPTSPDWQPR
jgi:hypothetical protein